MPIMSCNENNKPGYKYGESGHCYTYNSDDENSRKEAKKKAILQGVAIEGGSPHLEKSDYEDLVEDYNIEPEYMVKNEEQHTLFGWAYVAKKIDGTQVVDHSEEFVKEENFEDLEIATYAYNIAFREADIRHDCVAKGYLIDSMVFTKEKVEAMRKSGHLQGDIALGVWLGFYFPDDKDWNTIKSMKKPMFSLYGSAVKEYVEEV
jgi:predicted DNA-binding transcriptional regulator